MERKLAHVEEVVSIEPIEGADRIEYVTVLGWHVIQQKDTVKIGDKVVYIEIDSKVPANEIFAFLEKRDYKVKSMKMRGVISQGLIMTFDQLGLNPNDYKIGDDLSKKLNIKKIETQEEKNLKKAEAANKSCIMSAIKGRHPKLFQNKYFKKLLKHKWFERCVIKLLAKKKDKPRQYPSYIIKTDEDRIENVPWILKDKQEFIKTEKLDGTSSTYAVRRINKDKFEFIVCSRNVRQMDIDQVNYNTMEAGTNVYWEMAIKYKVKDMLIDIAKRYNQQIVILQGETIGNVQGNPYKLNENQLYGFNLIFTDERRSFYKKFHPIAAKEIAAQYGINWVPILDEHFVVPDTMEEMKALAEGKSVINPNVKREGIVCRSYGDDTYVSFKNVSNSYLLKKGE